MKTLPLFKLAWRFRFTASLLLYLALAGCGANPVTPQVEDHSEAVPVERETAAEPETATQREPAAEREPAKDATPAKPAASSAATQSLVAAATTAAEQNNHESAIAYLERAVRIDPRNADLWLRLSAAYLANGNLNAASQHNRKAIALAGDNPILQHAAWLQMADIEQAKGNFSEAQALRRRWGSARG